MPRAVLLRDLLPRSGGTVDQKASERHYPRYHRNAQPHDSNSQLLLSPHVMIYPGRVVVSGTRQP